MAIEWDYMIAEMTLLAAIIYGAIYVENLIEKRRVSREKKENAEQVIKFVTNDLKKKLAFIEGSMQYKDYKPFITDMWDAIILGGKQTLLPFEIFENLQHTYSWMKYYNNELEQNERSNGQTALIDIRNEVKQCINQSLKLLKQVN